MGSSFYITYGGNRLTFPGVTGSVAWEEKMVKVNLSNTDDYLRMRFVDSTGGETAIEVGSGATATASASVPVGVTAYWTANGCQTGDSARYHVTGLGVSGFANLSADTAVDTGYYVSPNVMSYGSATLTATDTASAQVETDVAYRVTYGEGSNNFYSTVSASSWAGQILGTWNYTTGRGMWIPRGAQVGFSASSISGRTYTVQPSLTALSGYAIEYNHKDMGTHSLVTGYLTGSSTLAFRLGGGRYKSVYATGTALQLANTSAISAACWQADPIISSFSSNLVSGSSTTSCIAGSANAGLVNGFESSTHLGTMKNSAGTWIGILGSTGNYKWHDVRQWVSCSAKMSGIFSAVRSKGHTGNNNATWVLYNRNSSNQSISGKAGQIAVPTASGKTATTTQTGEFSLTGKSANACGVFSMAVAQSTALYANCRGAWTASGVIL